MLTSYGYTGFPNNPNAFTQNVITPLENGNGANMPSPFAAGGQTARIPELAVGQNNYQPEIRIFTRMDNGAITYPAQVSIRWKPKSPHRVGAPEP